MTLLAEPTGNSSLAHTHAGWKRQTPTPVADAERTWREADSRRPLPRAADLLARVNETLLDIIKRSGADPQTRVAALRVHDLVSRLVFDGAPVPQVSESDDGGVEVVWLVGGRSVNADFLADGVSTFWATDAARHEIFVWDGKPSERIPEELLAFAQAYLRDLSYDVRVDVPR